MAPPPQLTSGKAKRDQLAFDMNMLDNFQYGGPVSQSNNALVSSPEKMRDTKTTSRDHLYLNSSRAKTTFGHRDKSPATISQKEASRYASLNRIHNNINPHWSTKQLATATAFHPKGGDPYGTAAYGLHKSNGMTSDITALKTISALETANETLYKNNSALSKYNSQRSIQSTIMPRAQAKVATKITNYMKQRQYSQSYCSRADEFNQQLVNY